MGMTIEEINKDFLRDDVRVLWISSGVALTLNGKILTVLSAEFPGLLDKITRWCDKNSYRCTQVHDGKIWL
jgi:hypothetical protein